MADLTHEEDEAGHTATGQLQTCGPSSRHCNHPAGRAAASHWSNARGSSRCAATADRIDALQQQQQRQLQQMQQQQTQGGVGRQAAHLCDQPPGRCLLVAAGPLAAGGTTLRGEPCYWSGVVRQVAGQSSAGVAAAT
jgi:hypothetical protein